MAAIDLRLSVAPDMARALVGEELTRQGFTVGSTPSGDFDVSRGSLGTTVVAGAFAGKDMHVRFDVAFEPTPNGTLVHISNSAMSGFLKGGAIGASRAGDVVREAAHVLGTSLAARGAIEGVEAAGPVDSAVPVASAAPVAPVSASIPPPIDYAGRTNVVAIVAIVLGFVFPVGGIAAGAVALSQVKRTGEKGRGLAIGGIVVGSVLTLLYILLAVALVVIGLLVQDDATDSSSSSGPGASEVAPGGQPSTSTEGESIDVFALAVGDCLDESDTQEVSQVERVDCALPHDYEVYTEFSLDGDTFPGTDVVDSRAAEGCSDAFPGFVGLAYEESMLDYSYFTPTEQSWNTADDRLVSCLVYDTAGKSTGSLLGVAR